MINSFSFLSPIGDITIYAEDESIVRLSFLKGENTETTPLLREAYSQITAYFEGRLFEFSLPLKLNTTPFCKKVYSELLKIPYGKLVSYKYIAEQCGNENASRAVGNANNKNPIPIIIPCHRVIGSNKKLVGYAGGLDIKKYLINLEKAVFLY